MNKKNQIMTEDTVTDGPRDQFPRTRWSAIVATGSEDSIERKRAFETIVAAYWKPVYKYVRIKWHQPDEDAKDLTQGFFTQAIEKEFFQRYDFARARFRTYLRTCLDGFVANELKAAKRVKRGGDTTILSLDFESAEGELQFSQIPSPASIDDYFDKEWVRSLFSLAVDALHEHCESNEHTLHFDIFERYDLDSSSTPEKITYDHLAEEFKIPVTQVTNSLAYARREFRRILLEKLREITATDEEFHDEARSLLGIDVK